MFESDERLTWIEAKEKCSAKDGLLAKFDTFMGFHMKQICTTCNSMHVGIQKVIRDIIMLHV